jgi:Uma2 family endonuclease
MSSAHLVTAEELERRPEDDYRYELVEGRVIQMSPVGCQRGAVVVQLMFLLKRHLQDSKQGAVFTEVGFKLASKPDTVRAPDVSFVAKDRMPSPVPRGFFQGPPISPSRCSRQAIGPLTFGRRSMNTCREAFRSSSWSIPRAGR